MDIIILIISLALLYKKKIAWVLFGIILLTNNYLNIYTGPTDFPFPHNVWDSGLILYLALSFYLLKKNNFKLPQSSLTKSVKIFYLFLLLSIFVDLIVNGIDMLSIVKTSRHWIFLSCIWIFVYIDNKDVIKLIKYLLNALVLISVIMLIEFFFNIRLFAEEIRTEYLSPGFLVEKGSIPSILILFFIIVLFTSYFKFKPGKKYLYISIFLSVIIVSTIRSLFIATVIGIIVIQILQKKVKFRTLLFGMIIVTSLIIIAYMNPILKERFSIGFSEIQGLNLKGNIQGNLSFRLLQALERLNYISQNLQYTIFGIGNVTEFNFPNIFIIGLRDLSGRVTQLDTADIAWSLLFIRLGFLGLILYLYNYVKVLYAFYLKRFQNPLALTMFIFLLINLVLISFTSSDIASGQFWLLPILVYYQIKNTSYNEI